ncbi:hypothetical protein B0A48_01334 [Cryoendolithus antarcticus]|uniref:F-box domain-containing protein n=1 Tax=Cryoendolithus antarcticus TaxID=1507870 RepID=A0A1V8TT29_9PEZI|nr:hypothetical protein B0A48_01334 [Cryoendolithus antarcticus]
MASNPTTLLDLPIDIILLLLPYLDASSFLSLTSTCRDLHSPSLVHDPAYWSHLVRTTFRVPNQPVVQTNGHRWQKLYKRLFTQSRVMTWGDNDKACLGHSFASRADLAAVPPGMRRLRQMRMRHVSWPGAMAGTEGLGVISDLQCGGWSTTLLTSKGALYTVGVMDGLHSNQRRPPFVQPTKAELTALRFPSGFVQPQERYDEATAVQQFSAGRGHVLALSDSGRIWTWQNIEHAGLQVRFIEHDTTGSGGVSGRGVVKKVAAGWNKSAALIEGSGIVVWEPLQREEDDVEAEDTALVLESVAVPKTSWRKTRSGRSTQPGDASLEDTVGEVLNFIVLEAVVLFNTSLGKLFVSQITWSDDDQSISEPLEILLTTSDDIDEAFATDVQGSFHNFAVFTRSGAVLTAHQDRIMDLLQNQNTDREIFKRIPALQHRDVISVAFGDYHFHALHSPGYITSYGTEPQACGALGLGGHGDPEGRLRGIRYQAMGGDGRLVPHAYTEGRRVWFEHEKQQWISFLTSGGASAEEAAERLRMAIGSPDITGQGEVSEWVEQEGRNWEEKFGLQDEDEDGLGAYFALSVTAAGWHSGALVLVNDDLAKKVAKACELPTAAKDVPSNPSGDDTDEAEFSDSSVSSSEPNNVSLLTRALTLSYDYAQWFLGIGPYSHPSNTTAQNLPHPGVDRPPTYGYPQTAARHPPTPVDYGASPREGVDYVWVNDHFPRLRLSDGREMPGGVDFSEWRYGRPEWDLEFQP